MKKLTLIIAIIISLKANCQEIESEKDKPENLDKLLMGINFSPDYGKMKYDSENELMKPGFSSGINFRYNITNKWSIEGGVQYSNKKYGYEIGGLIFGDLIDPMNGVYYADSATLKRAKCSYKDVYIDLPIRTIKYFGSSRLRFFTGAGITANILLKTQTECILENDNSVKQTIYFDSKKSKLNISTNISIGAEYKINKKIKVQIEPIYRQGLLNISNSMAKIKFWNLGLNFTTYLILK
jgi:hypothetical protein